MKIKIKMNSRAIIAVSGVVQGVGFRYFIYRKAVALNLKGFTENLYTGEVLTVVEGEKAFVEELINTIKVGTAHSSIRSCSVQWEEFKNEFNNFEIRT